jgi:hypothetical protein
LRTWRWTAAVLLGALVATVGDHLHVVYGVLFYPHPVFLQQAWWVFPLFVGATWAMVSGAETVRRALGKSDHAGGGAPGRAVGGARAPTNLAEVALATGAFFLAYAFTAVAAELPNLVLVVLLLTWLLRVHRLPRWVLAFGVLAAACGVASESALSAMGLFKYVNPDGLGVPRWLPALYLHASVTAVCLRGLL